jgi:hypothetical protein
MMPHSEAAHRAELGVLEQPLELLPGSLVGLGSQRIAGRQYAVGG